MSISTHPQSGRQPRVVFVDDDALLLRSLRRVMRRDFPSWNMVFVETAADALQKLDEQPTDVVVSDMCMGAMDGATFLSHVQDQHPACVRIILSGSHEPTLVCRSAEVAHQFLTKPIAATHLGDTLKRACDLKELLGNEKIRSLIAANNELPAAPSIYTRLVHMLADPEVDISQVADVLSRDVALSARLIQVSGSAFFGRQEPPTDVRGAVVQLGLPLTRTLLLTFEVARIFSSRSQNFSIDQMQRLAIRTGLLVCRVLDDAQGEGALLAGVLHGVGQLVLAARLPRELDEIIIEAKRTGKPIAQVQTDHWGVSYAEIGAYLLGIWGLPPAVVSAVAKHQRPSQLLTVRDPLNTALYVAHRLARDPDVEATYDTGDCCAAIDLGLLEAHGTVDQLPSWRTYAQSLHEQH